MVERHKIFKMMLRVCGLSQADAAEFLGASLQSIKSWSSGHRQVPPGVMAELSAYFTDMVKLAQDNAKKLAKGQALEFGTAEFWPSKDAQTAFVAMSYLLADIAPPIDEEA